MALDDILPPIDRSDPSENVIRREKDFILKEIKLFAFNGAEYNMLEHRVLLTYFEDLFMNCLTGTLDMLDAIDYPQFMPLVGEERLKVILTRQDETGKGKEGGLLPDLEMNFRIYKVSGRQIQNEKVQTYRLHLIAEEFIKNLKQKVYRSWKDTKYSDMVQEIFDEKLKVDAPIIVEPTKYEQDFTCSNLAPIEFINMVACRSISDEGNGEAYLFYQDRDGFHFTTLGKLLSQGSAEEYIHGPRQKYENQSSKFSFGQLPIEKEVKNIEHYFWNSQHDILKNIESGMYGQRLTTVDPVRQKFDFLKFNLKDEFGSFPHVDKEKFFTDDLDALPKDENDVFACTKLICTNKDHDIVEHIAAREPGIKPDKLEEYVLRRTSHLNQINNFRIGVSVSGDPRRKVGDVITFNLPQVAGDVSEQRPEELDKYFQGKYLIVSIRHTLTQASYSMEFEMIKDSFFKPIEHVDVVDKYKDII